MKSFQRNGQDLSGSAKPASLVSALTLALLLGGCSADVGRFDFPAFNLNGDSGTTTSALPTPSEPMQASNSPLSRGNDSYTGGNYPPPASRGNDRVDMAALPEPSAPSSTHNSRPTYGDTYGSASYQPPRATYQPSRPSHQQASEPRYEASERAAAAGGAIEVQRGDTLYGLARANGVTVKELMAANGLASATIRPGQTLRLPGGASPVAAPLDPAPARQTAVAGRAPASSRAAETSDWRGTYQVQPGDSLYRIARRHNIRVADLQHANEITNPRQLKPGVTLRVPGPGDASATVASAPSATAPASAGSHAPYGIQSTTQPTIINNGEQRVAALNTGRSLIDAAPAAAASPSGVKPVQTVAITPSQIGTASLRWPSKGKIISGFGQRADGTHNDGVNIAVPRGTDVHAAAEGEVAYAGSELKGYGNLILLRHDNGWVTAYAHADQLLVKRGDKVRRGDVIAKAGATGQVDQPQLHFELRQGSKPVDPLPYLDRL